MTAIEILLVLAIAALVYQEISWRDRARRIETDYEKRISSEVAMVYGSRLAEDEGPVRAFTFHAEKEEPRGLFREVTRHLFIAITMSGDTVKYAAGDLNEIDRFEIPPEIRRALLDYMTPEASAGAFA
jgi:hypothetical protein